MGSNFVQFVKRSSNALQIIHYAAGQHLFTITIHSSLPLRIKPMSFKVTLKKKIQIRSHILTGPLYQVFTGLSRVLLQIHSSVHFHPSVDLDLLLQRCPTAETCFDLQPSAASVKSYSPFRTAVELVPDCWWKDLRKKKKKLPSMPQPCTTDTPVWYTVEPHHCSLRVCLVFHQRAPRPQQNWLPPVCPSCCLLLHCC